MKADLKLIFEANYVLLYNYASSIIKDKHTAEDLVQTVFIQLWQNGKLMDIQEPRPFLLKCVKYKCIDFLRSQKRNKEVLLKELPELDNFQESLPEEDTAAMLNYFAAMLPSKMQRIFLMSRTQGMTYKQIAQELNISQKTVENQMGTALKKLRVLLKKHKYLSLFAIISDKILT